MPKLRRLVEAPPDARGDAEEQLRDLRDYLIGVTEELEYVLTHLEAENIDDTMWERISALIPKPYGGAPLMDGASSAGGSRNYARGDHRHPKDASKADAAALTSHAGNTANPHGVTKTQVGLGNVDNVRQYSASNPPPYPVTSVNGATGAVTVSVPEASDASPQMDGAAAAGSSGDFARADHVHPTDTGRAPKAHASSGTDYGIGSDANYGHLRLSNQTGQNSGVTGGVAATPLAVKTVYDLASGKADPGDIPSAYTSNPAMDGTASPGSSTKWAKGDHVHPSDTSKQDVLTFDNVPAKWSANPVKSSGIFSALMVKAAQGQLAPMEDGNNTSRAYASGDYFYWSLNDMLLRATTAIASGSTIEAGVNCEEVQFGNELNKKPGYELLAPLETSTTASRAYSYGERFVYNGVLYEAIASIAAGGTITPGTNCQDAANLESRFRTYNYTANGTYTVTLARNSRRYLVIADRLGRAAALVNYIAYNGNTPQMVTIADIDSANRGISLSVSGATLTITVSATYAVVKIMEV